MKKFFYSEYFNKLCNVFLSCLYGWFFYHNYQAAIASNYKPSIILFMIFNAVLVCLFLTRRNPNRISFHPQDLIATFIGTFSTTMVVGVADAPDHIILEIIGTLGFTFSMLGILTLRKSFGMLPADRGIVKVGVYKIVRHPIYAGYLLHYSCFLAQNYNIRNAFIFLLFVFFECYRLVREEKLLTQNPEYFEYTKTTPWRICPKIW
jgi:protein-S-isoprenylcysteine O-methyltransferase Ste14